MASERTGETGKPPLAEITIKISYLYPPEGQTISRAVVHVELSDPPIEWLPDNTNSWKVWGDAGEPIGTRLRDEVLEELREILSLWAPQAEGRQLRIVLQGGYTPSNPGNSDEQDSPSPVCPGTEPSTGTPDGTGG